MDLFHQIQFLTNIQEAAGWLFWEQSAVSQLHIFLTFKIFSSVNGFSK